MNKNNLKGLVITIGTILAVFCILGLFFWLLPYILLGGVIIAIVVLVIRTIKNIKNNSNYSECNNYGDNLPEDEFYSEDDVNSNEVIDVDFKEIDPK